MYRFRLGAGAICHLEEKHDVDIMGMFRTFQSGSCKVSMIRSFIIAGSLDKPDMSMTTAEATDLIDEVGVMPFVDGFTDSILAAFNAREEKKKKKAPGAGSKSSSARGKAES